MRKPLIALQTMLLTGVVLLGVVAAQQSTSSTPTTSSTSTTPSKKQSATPGKKKSTAAAKKKTAGSPPLTLTTQRDKVSYALGMNIALSLGANLKRQGVDINSDVLAQALKDGLNGGKTLMTEEEARTTLMQVQTELQAKQQEKAKQEADNNKKEGDAFLAANKSKPGVITLPSGLQYKIVKEGTGPKPTASDTVVCNYRGTLINGTEFDSSYKRGQPATFPVGGVIKGWTEALQLMPVGSKWDLYIPPDLAYGARGAGNDIGPNATLIFEVELLSIQPKEGAQPGAAQPGASPSPSPAAAASPSATPSPSPAATPKK
jgi:FKBP-type peptidyl-prolyl cis-trans isomerase FklB